MAEVDPAPILSAMTFLLYVISGSVVAMIGYQFLELFLQPNGPSKKE